MPIPARSVAPTVGKRSARSQSLDVNAVVTLVVAAVAESVFSKLAFTLGAQSAAIAVISYGAMAACAIYLSYRLWGRDDRTAVVILIAAALAIRLPALSSQPILSSDAYRYIWDGELLAHGLDPHAVTPLAPEAGFLRSTWLWPHIDYRTIPDVYPPFAFALFALAARDSSDLWGAKGVALAGDTLVLAALFAVLAARRLPRGRAALYALHPLAVLEFAGSAHIEAWAVAGIVFAAGLPSRAGSTWGRAVALAIAGLTKLYPLVLAPVIFARNRVALSVAAVIVLLAYATQVAGGHPFGSAADYVLAQRFNGSLGAILGTGGEIVIVAIGASFAFRMVRGGGDPALAALVVVVAYLLSSPNVLPWYVLVLPPLVCVMRDPFAPAWRAAMLGIVAWSFTVAIAYGAPRLWSESSTLGWTMRAVEYAPLYAGLVIAAMGARRSNDAGVAA